MVEPHADVDVWEVGGVEEVDDRAFGWAVVYGGFQVFANPRIPA
jgi:hypothetical protein